MNKRNSLIKEAFEQAAKKELELLPEEENIIRTYSDEFQLKTEKLFEAKSQAAPKKKLRFGKVAVIAAVLAVLLTFTASAFITGGGMWKLFNFKSDPERYQKIEVEVEDSYENDEVFVEKVMEYTGEPITVKYYVDTGESWNWPDKGIMVYIDGVRQTFSAKVGEQEHKNIEMLHMENEKGTEKNVEITLKPNVGKKGDEMYLSVVVIFDPEVTCYPQCISEHKLLRPMHYDYDRDDFCDRCSTDVTTEKGGPSSLTVSSESMTKIVMKQDAPVKTEITENYSGLKTSELNERIYKSYGYESSDGKHNEYDTMEGFATVIYKDVKDSYFLEWGVWCHSTRIETKAKEKDEFILNLHGATGKYRVSLFVNNEIKPVFDGAYYTDVDIVHGQQSELAVSLDTTKLPKGDNYFYVMYEKLDGNVDVFRSAENGRVYTVEVR